MLVRIPQDPTKAEYRNIPDTMRTYEIVSKIAYLIGVKKLQFERDTLKPDWYDRLQDVTEARIIRSLCKIRTSLLKYYEDVDFGIQYQMKNLDKMPGFFDAEDLAFLDSQKIPVIKVNYRANAYIADMNRLIAQHIHACRELFPIWLEWEYIRDLFVMPSGTKEATIAKERLRYKDRLSSYPFHMYLHWHLIDQGNILLNDGKFVQLLYIAHRDCFTDINKIMDAGEEVKNGLYGYIAAHHDIVMVVDCENSDPYKLCATLRRIAEDRSDIQDHIKKIILYDDSHASSAWRILESYVSIPIQYELVERVSDYKSLVDIRMAAGTCKEYYQNQTNAFIIASSDSDYWGLISALPTAAFLVMTEYEKCGERLRYALNNAGMFYCFIDDFCRGNISDIKVEALLCEVRAYVESSIQLNVNTMLESVYARTRISLSASEKKNFYDKFIKTMRLVISDNGDVNIDVE